MQFLRLSTVSVLTLFWLLCAVPAYAQVPVPSPTPVTTMLAWDHDGVNVTGFRLRLDGGVPSDLGAVVRQADGHYEIRFPALTPGLHVVAISAYNIAGESGAATLSVQLVVIPATPSNLRIVVN